MTSELFPSLDFRVEKKPSVHRSGWREHGLIKGKADFSSCRSCTDRPKQKQKNQNKTQKKVYYTKPVSSPSLLLHMEDDKVRNPLEN